MDGVIAALEAQPFAAVPVEWRDGPSTTATGSLEVVRGTGRRVQSPDCLAECRTNYHFAVPCRPDELRVDAHGTVSTLDGRVVDASWTGSLIAMVVNGHLAWSVFPQPIPARELEGTLDLVTVAEVRDGSRDLGLRVFLAGTDGTLRSISFDASSTHGTGELEATIFSVLGGTPRQ